MSLHTRLRSEAGTEMTNNDQPFQAPNDTPSGEKFAPPYAPPNTAPFTTPEAGPYGAGPYGAGSYGAGPYGGAGPYSATTHGVGWVAPSKPGVIPLRPLTLGNIIGASFQTLRRNPKTTFGTALLLNSIATLIGFFVMFFVFNSTISELMFMINYVPNDPRLGGTVAILLLSTIPAVLLSILVLALMQGIVVLSLSRDTVGEKVNLRGVFMLMKGRVWTLISWALLQFVALVLVVVLVFFVAILFAQIGREGAIIAVFVSLIALPAAIVLGVFLYTKLSLVSSAIVLDRLSVFKAIGRSWGLTRGYFWKTLGSQFIVSMILSVVSQIVTIPLTFILALLMGMLAPTGGSFESAMTVVLVFYVLLSLFSAALSAIITVAQSATSGLVYLDIRMRKEGLNQHLTRFVENKQAGVSVNPDPYLEPALLVETPMNAPYGFPTWAPGTPATAQPPYGQQYAAQQYAPYQYAPQQYAPQPFQPQFNAPQPLTSQPFPPQQADNSGLPFSHAGQVPYVPETQLPPETNSPLPPQPATQNPATQLPAQDNASIPSEAHQTSQTDPKKDTGLTPPS